MTYLNLRPQQLNDLAALLYENYSLVVLEKPTSATYVDSETNDKINWFRPVYRISLVQNGIKKFVTFSNTKFLALTNPEQFNFFSRFNLVREKLRPRLIKMFIQLCEENNLIVP